MAARVLAVAVAVVLGLIAASPARAADQLLAGVGRADITPPTGFYMMGWVRSDDLSQGTLTRLYARVVVLQEGARKIALVAEDVNAIPGGALADAARLDSDIGFSDRNVLDTASHTHAAPSGWYNFNTYNTVAPTPDSPTTFSVSFEPQLYSFMVNRLALAIRRANADLGPARIGWGHTTLLGLTQNRSLEAHLANFGINEPYGSGTVAQDPGGYADTIDPNVDVLRIDKLLPVPAGGSVARPRTVCSRRRSHHVRCHRARTAIVAGGLTTQWYPVGMWSTFANHGTVVKSDFHYYNGDHQAAATRAVEDQIRAAGGVPATQEVVNIFGNSDAGDVTSGLQYSGPADADYVGRREAQAMMDAWRQAGESMTTTPTLDRRWTRVCFCGQEIDGMGQVASEGAFGLPQLTGSEEGRGGLFQLTHVPFEGMHLPTDVGPQGDKIIDIPETGDTFPKAVPLMAVRIGDRLLVSEPGEPTAEVGKRLRAAVMATTAGSGVNEVVVAGYANEYVDYFTTPAEYEAQHYEGGSTIYGKLSSVFLQDSDVALAKTLVDGQPAPTPYAYDPVNGVHGDNTPFPSGATSGSALAQPSDAQRLSRASFSWQGGPTGYDRPLDTPFVTVLQRVGSSWRAVDNDLGLDILWYVDNQGRYTAEWQIPASQPAGTYAFLITANKYRLQSQPFQVVPANTLTLQSAPAGGDEAAASVSYPPPVYNLDLVDRAAQPSGGSITFLVNGHPLTVQQAAGAVFTVTAGANDSVSVPAGGFRDAWGNTNATAVDLRPPPPPPPTNGQP